MTDRSQECPLLPLRGWFERMRRAPSDMGARRHARLPETTIRRLLALVADIMADAPPLADFEPYFQSVEQRAIEVQGAREELNEIRNELRALRVDSAQRAVERRDFKPVSGMPPARLDVERAMSTTGIFQQPMYSDWSAQEMAAEEIPNVRN